MSNETGHYTNPLSTPALHIYCCPTPPPQHIVKCHGSTLLPQFLGMYRVGVDSEETYLIVMRNMFSHRLVVHRKYDLKVRRKCMANSLAFELHIPLLITGSLSNVEIIQRSVFSKMLLQFAEHVQEKAQSANSL